MLTSGQKKLAIEPAKKQLSGVGQLPTKVEQYPYAFHYRRALTDEEIAGLDPAWLAIPGVDPAGEGKLIEVDT